MTERAKIREEYKKEKRLPAPEIPKRKPSKKEPRKIVVESKYLREDFYQLSDIFPWLKLKERKEWEPYKKYRTFEDAQKAVEKLNKARYGNIKFSEYRIRPDEEK